MNAGEMKILVGCERSGVVRRALAARGHQVWSCDLAPAIDGSSMHIQADVADVAYSGGWDMMIAHPPCTYTSYSGARWWTREGWRDEQQKALLLFAVLLAAPIDKIALENPRGLAMRLIRWPDDVIQPFEFGDRASKRTYLWLKNLPPLMKTLINLDYVNNWTTTQHGFSRSITFPGIADAMARQWT